MLTMLNKRNTDRYSTSINALVKVRETDKEVWKETAEIIDISKNGATVFLSRECKVGRLISLLIPLPTELRLYDQDKEFYRVWGIIQHCSPIKNSEDLRCHIGIAFIGKFAPESFKNDPRQSFRISGINEKGLWNIVEAPNDFVNREYPRYWVSLEVSIAFLKTEGELIEDNEAVTENVSQKGAALRTNLVSEIGDRINFVCEEYDFSTIAVVRNRVELENDQHRLHLEFPEDFPIEKITLPFFDDDKTQLAQNEQMEMPVEAQSI